MSKTQKTLLLVLMAASMVALNADTQVMAPMLVTIEAEFGVDDSAVGAMMALFTVVGAVVSLLWGYFADKASRKKLFVFSVALGEIPCALTALAPSWEIFFALRILTGIGVGAAFPLVFSILGDIYDENERPMASAILTTAFGLGAIVGPVLGGFVGQVSGWRLPFVLAAVPNVPLLLAFWFLVPEPRAAASEEATRELVEAGILYPKHIRVKDYARLGRVPTNVYLFIQGIAGTIPWGAFFFLNKFLETAKGFSIGQATAVYMVFGAGMVVGNLAGGKLGELVFRRSPKNLPLFCGVTTFLGCFGTLAVVTLKGSIPLLSAAGFLAAFFAAMTGPNMRTMLLDVNPPEDRGPIFSIFNLTDSLGTGLGRWVAGMLSVAVGLSGALAISASFWVICGVVLVLAARIFPGDISVLKERMAQAAREMRAAR
ncbi:MAG: MFS transporter [Treponema sp.]|nr:MFS transporter [Treponema sp.]